MSHLHLVPRDPVDRALAAMKADLQKPWTVPQLARSVGVSRAVLARRFAERGMTPIGALTRLRLERAAELVRERDVTLAEVADRVGYRSEFAFNRAFKRHHGVAPGRFRRGATTLLAA
ncbi:MAG: helix-turn-helix transcriptional regulator [Polyangiales bacterium]|nr:helix-turn-helix transcriptional regulator [Sandaracinus sp.]